MIDLGSLAVHDPAGADDLAAKNLADRLMAKTNAEDRDLAGEKSDDFFREARIFWCPGAGRDDDPFGPQFLDLRDAYFVVAIDLELFAQLAEILDEIIGERVVVIDH